MAVRRPKPEEFVVKLRQVEVLMGQGMTQSHSLSLLHQFRMVCLMVYLGLVLRDTTPLAAM